MIYLNKVRYSNLRIWLMILKMKKISILISNNIRFFLKEFSLDDASANKPKPEEVKYNLEKYGSYKPPKRPTEKINNH